MFPARRNDKMINIRGDGYANDHDLIITHCVRVLKNHTVTPKYAKLCVDKNKTKQASEVLRTVSFLGTSHLPTKALYEIKPVLILWCSP